MAVDGFLNKSEQLSSKDNPFIKHVRRLLTDSGYRKEKGEFVIEGARLCEDALLSGVAVSHFFYTPDAKNKYPAQIDAFTKVLGIKKIEINDKISSSISETKTPQGVFCLCRAGSGYSTFAEDGAIGESENSLEDFIAAFEGDAKLLGLEDVRDPSNVGTIIRTAEAFGISALVINSKSCDIYNSKVIRGSMGGIFRLKIFVVDDFVDAVLKLNAKGFKSLALVLDRKAVSLKTEKLLKGNVIALLGNEGEGLSAQAASAATHLVTIPMKGRAESLNVAAAASVVAWELSLD